MRPEDWGASECFVVLDVNALVCVEMQLAPAESSGEGAPVGQINLEEDLNAGAEFLEAVASIWLGSLLVENR